jgi:hypothetical protein
MVLVVQMGGEGMSICTPSVGSPQGLPCWLQRKISHAFEQQIAGEVLKKKNSNSPINQFQHSSK